jgi:nickel/cobalt transporter (NicO) family protein
VAVAFVLALTHVGSAVILALLAAPLVTRTLGGVGRAHALELISRGALVAIGLWLLYRAFRGRRHGAAIERLVRVLDGLSAVCLIAIAGWSLMW